MSFYIDLTYPECEHCKRGPSEVFDWSITFNLAEMFTAALGNGEGIRQFNGKLGKEAKQPLEDAINRMLDNPGDFKKFAPSNSWGDYAGAVEFFQAWEVACSKWPDATIEVR